MILDNEDVLICNSIKTSKNPFILLRSFVGKRPIDHAEELLKIINMIELPNDCKFNKRILFREQYVNAHIGRSNNYVMGLRFVDPFAAVDNIHGDCLLIGFKPDPKFISRKDIFELIDKYNLHICESHCYELIICSI